MTSMRHGIVLGLFLLLPSSSALAVNVGHIQGYVLDELGSPLPEAIVIVTGEGTVGTWHCHTDEKGFYRIPGLEASRDLSVRVESPGRTSVVRTGYRLRDEQVLRLNFRLRPEGSRMVLILVDGTIAYHRRALEGVRSSLERDAPVMEVRDGSHGTLSRLMERLEERPDGIIAIGTLAARLARSATDDIPVVHLLVPDPRRQGLVRGNMCGVPANGAFGAQMEMLRAEAPQVRRLGAIYVPDRLAEPLAGLRAAAAGHGLDLVTRSLHSPSDLQAALDSLGREGIDAFYLFLDPELWTPGIAAAVSEFTLRRGILLLLPEDGSLQADHAVSYAPDPQDLGAFAGGLMISILERRTSLPAVGLVYPPPSALPPEQEEEELLEEVREIMQARCGERPSGGVAELGENP